MSDHRPARSRALAKQDEAIAENVRQIEEAKPRPTAIQAMATRLGMSTGNLQNTLRQTVFKDASDSEFAALVVVSNEYRLNPLLKEILAFKGKGGGIIPYVSVDGWIRIINEHPQFDGVEFEDIVGEDGELEAIECVIYRKDRTRPIRVTEYMDECVRDTEPWRKSPKRFLRHRALMQCGRVAFGFSGIGPEDDYEIVPYAQSIEPARVRLPSRAETAGEVIDEETGEVLGDADEAAEEADRRALRQMDRDTGHGDRGEDAGENGAQAQPEPRQAARSTRRAAQDRTPAPDAEKGAQAAEIDYKRIADTLIEEIEASDTVQDVNSFASSTRGMPDDYVTLVTDAANRRKAEIRARESAAPVDD